MIIIIIIIIKYPSKQLKKKKKNLFLVISAYCRNSLYIVATKDDLIPRLNNHFLLE